jgi:ATP-dependent helicase HrpB
MVALELRERPGQEALVRVASSLEPDWLEATSEAIEHHLDRRGVIQARRISRYQALTLGETRVPPNPEACLEILVEHMLSAPEAWVPSQLRQRLRFAEINLDLRAHFQAMCLGRTRLPEGSILDQLDYPQRQRLLAQAPTSWTLPSGRESRLEYRSDGSVVAAAKLQELFGLCSSPRLGPKQTPLRFSLLAPSGRSVQLTDDLESFWRVTYPEIRKELRGRYPKHPWPEDPFSAPATFRTKPRRTS